MPHSVVKAEALELLLRFIEERALAMEALEMRREMEGLGRELPRSLLEEIMGATTQLAGATASIEERLLVMEGIDKAGKETQCFNPTRHKGVKSVAQFLRDKGYEVEGLSLPSYDTPLGALVAAQLGRPSSWSLDGRVGPDLAWILWSLDRAQHSKRLRDWVRSGPRRVALVKRWTHSNLAYHCYRGVEPSRILRLEEALIKPRHTIVLDLRPKLAEERLSKSGEVRDVYEWELGKIRGHYLRLPQLYPYGDLYLVDASGPLEEVNARVLEVIDSIVRGWSDRVDTRV